jgi:hypothetical protein
VPIDVNLRNRAWLLGLVRVANWAGLRPVSNRHVHALVFLANSLAPIYQDEGVETRVVKQAQGPFYPDAQWDLDRMVGQRLLTISNDRPSYTEDGWMLNTRYEVTTLGIELVKKFRQAPILDKSYNFLVELAAAFASLTGDERDTAPLEDAIYSIPNRPNGTALVFENATDNYSVLTASAFDELVGAELTLSPRDRVHLYLRYLARSAQAREARA